MAAPAHYFADDPYESFDLATPTDRERAVEEAEHGKVIYLHRKDHLAVAMMPAEIADAALAALEEAEDAADVAAARARRAAGERGIPMAVLKAEAEAELER